MDRHQNNLLVHQEAMYVLIGTMIGVGSFNLPNVLVKDAYEGAWISAILGGIYPLYLGFLGIYIIKKHPSENILDLSKLYLGKFLGTGLNIIFLVFFSFIAVFVISGFNIIYQIYTTTFLSPFRIISIMTLISAFVTYKGLKVIGKVNSVAFYITVILVLMTFAVLRKGSYLNLMPVLGAGALNILKSSKEAVFSYSGIEILFIIYPYIKDNLKFGKNILKGVGITVVIYTLITALTLYYLSADILKKTYWSWITVSESLNIPVINNFRIVFAFLWMGIALKTASNFYFATAFIGGSILKKVKRITIISVIYLIYVSSALMLGEATVRSKVIELVIGKITLFNILYITIIAFLIFMKKDVGNENK